MFPSIIFYVKNKLTMVIFLLKAMCKKEITESLSLGRGPWRSSRPTLCRAESARASCPRPSPVGVWKSPAMDSLQLLWATCSSAWTLTAKKFCLTFKSIVFQFVPIASCLVTGHHWEKFGSIFFSPLIRHLYTLVRPPLHFLFSRPNSLNPLSLSL